MIKIAITGSTGFIGKRLTSFLTKKGAIVISLRRELFNPEKSEELSAILNGCDVVINLAGSPINCRWTKANKRKIKESRIRTTRTLVEAINNLPIKPSTFISTSAVGIYSEAEVWNETDGEHENDFLSRICQRWEAEAKKVSKEVRLVILRLGVVLDKEEGAFPKMMLPFTHYLGGQIGSGRQGFSWIHIYDLLNAFFKVISEQDINGVVHCTAPQICDNLLFTYTLARTIHRPVVFHYPEFVFRLLYGKGAVVVTKGQKVFPSKLLNNDFHFEYPDLKSAMRELCII